MSKTSFRCYAGMTESCSMEQRPPILGRHFTQFDQGRQVGTAKTYSQGRRTKFFGWPGRVRLPPKDRSQKPEARGRSPDRLLTSDLRPLTFGGSLTLPRTTSSETPLDRGSSDRAFAPCRVWTRRRPRPARNQSSY